MNLPTPFGLLQTPGTFGDILRQMPRTVLEAAEKQDAPWPWLAQWVAEHTRKGERTGHFTKAFEAAASQREAFLRLVEIARGGGSVSQSWRSQMQAAKAKGDHRAVAHWCDKIAGSILQLEKGRQWLLHNKLQGLNAPPEIRRAAEQIKAAAHKADVRRLGKTKADEKWNSTDKPKIPLRFKRDTIGDKIAEVMTCEWLVVGKNGFPGLCFMSDQLLAQLLGYTMPVPSLLNTDCDGWKTVRTIRERIGLKKAGILFTGIEQVGEYQWAILNRHREKTHSISTRPEKPLPPKL